MQPASGRGVQGLRGPALHRLRPGRPTSWQVRARAGGVGARQWPASLHSLFGRPWQVLMRLVVAQAKRVCRLRWARNAPEAVHQLMRREEDWAYLYALRKLWLSLRRVSKRARRGPAAYNPLLEVCAPASWLCGQQQPCREGAVAGLPGNAGLTHACAAGGHCKVRHPLRAAAAARPGRPPGARLPAGLPAGAGKLAAGCSACAPCAWDCQIGRPRPAPCSPAGLGGKQRAGCNSKPSLPQPSAQTHHASRWAPGAAVLKPKSRAPACRRLQARPANPLAGARVRRRTPSDRP